MSAVDDYIATQSDPQKSIFQAICRVAREVIPSPEETTSYGMPAFKYKGKYVLGFFAYKDHMSLFPTPGPIAALKDELQGFSLAKGTIQFTADHQIPEDILRQLVHLRVTEIGGKDGTNAK